MKDEVLRICGSGKVYVCGHVLVGPQKNPCAVYGPPHLWAAVSCAAWSFQKWDVRQVVKQQQMDENARLRATLEEWSHRNARYPVHCLGFL